ncbi:MAG TPA: PAS domain S-box protein [Bryobacteraceae bacterium]|nr:PAS domain S-box protein [Bryobacteraceae bacterium]
MVWVKSPGLLLWYLLVNVPYSSESLILNFSADKLQSLLENLSDGFIILDREWRFVFLNAKAAAMARKPVGDLMKKLVWEEFPATAGTNFQIELERCVSEKIPIHFEEYYEDFDVWFEVNAYPSEDGVNVLFRDVTQRKLAEADLRDRARVWAFSAAVAEALTTATTLQVMLQRSCEAIVRELDAAFARIWTVSRGSDTLTLQASAGMYTHLDGAHAVVPVGSLKIGLIAKERKPHLTNSVVGDSRVADQEWAKREGMVAFAGYPLIIEEQLVGVVAMFARNPLSQVVIESMAAVANGIALGIHRKATEEELRESEARYRLTAESASDGIVSINSQSVIQSVNGAMATIFGYKREDLIGAPLTKLMPERFRERHKGGFTRYQQTRVRTLPWNGLELPGLRQDGREIALEISFGELAYRGEHLITGVIRDVTSRKQAERRTQTQFAVTSILSESNTFEAIGQAIEAVCEGLEWDLGSFWTVDERFNRMSYLIGWQRDSGRLGEFQELNRHTTFQPGEGLPGQAWASGQPIWISDFPHSEYPRSASASAHGLCTALAFPIRVEHKVIGVIEFFSRQCLAMNNDVIQTGSAISHQIGQFLSRLLAEQARVRKEAELAQSNEDLQQFAAIASHDLKEPLRTISSYIDRLQARYKDRLEGDAEEYLAFVSDGAKRMTSLLDSLLAYSSVDAREELQAVALADVMRDVRLNLLMAMERSLAILTHDPLPIVTGDKGQLTQLFQNLIGNAIKYRGTAAPRIHVGAERKDDAWILSVRDNGIGMAEQYHDTIFKVFKRLHGADIPGAGMGLAICKRIVERHGGRIWVESQPGKGSTVYFTLPPGENSASSD